MPASIDQVHKVLISTLGWLTGLRRMIGLDPSVVSGAGEFFTSLESVIGCAPRTPPPSPRPPRSERPILSPLAARPVRRDAGGERTDTAKNKTGASFPGERT